MTTEFLPIYVSNAVGEAAELLAEVGRPDAEAAQVERFCHHLRVAGIGAFFLTARPRELRWRLHQSAQAYAFHLAHVTGTRVGSAATPFLDAVGAGDEAGARAIAAASARAFSPGEEYPEDFLHLEFLMQAFYLDAPGAEGEALLARWEKALKGAVDHRLDVCRALLDSSASDFERALEAHLELEDQGFRERHQSDSIAPADYFTIGKLSSTGLAYARLAKRVGLAVANDHLHVPSLALDETPLPWSPDSWRSI